MKAGMKDKSNLQRIGATAILSRMLLAFSLLFVDLFTLAGHARNAPAPSGTAHLVTDPLPAIVPLDAARAMASLPQNDVHDANSRQTARLGTIPATAFVAHYPRTPSPRAAQAHLRPFAQGPPVA